MSGENDIDHPWQVFIDARYRMICYLMQQGIDDADIARRLSMDGAEHVRAIVWAMKLIESDK